MKRLKLASLKSLFLTILINIDEQIIQKRREQKIFGLNINLLCLRIWLKKWSLTPWLVQGMIRFWNRWDMEGEKIREKGEGLEKREREE